MRSLCAHCALPKTIGKKLLEGMEAYVCEDCLKGNKSFFEQQEPKTAKSAPFNQSELQSLTSYQRSQIFYPYVCPKGHVLAPSSLGLNCDNCSFTLGWAYTWTLNGSWKPLNSVDPTGSPQAERQRQFV